ncbi:MAG: 5'-deoxynucleotidase YfbR-like HD superfamily hydrolase [Acidimicrobiales bacterium]|jgi:5'-deoxynucleotidase YfbR-like HD superfamily hydrolase
MKIFSKDEVLQEIHKLQYLYGLKQEIRYGDKRPESTVTESVAEHIYGMHILASYFMPLENPDHSWDREKIYNLITWHDIDEIETGDIIGYLKTDEDRVRESEAKKTVVQKSPELLQRFITDVLCEYQKQETIEAQYVKAIDKIEPLCQIFNENGKKVLLTNGTTLEENRRIKDPYVQKFPYIKHFTEVVSEEMQAQGFFTEST